MEKSLRKPGFDCSLRKLNVKLIHNDTFDESVTVLFCENTDVYNIFEKLQHFKEGSRMRAIERSGQIAQQTREGEQVLLD